MIIYELSLLSFHTIITHKTHAKCIIFVYIVLFYLVGKPGQVSTMSLMENYLYIGVTSGVLLVVDPPTLTPIIAIACHEGPVKHLITVVTEPYIPAHTTSPEQSESIMMNQNSSLTVMTIGNGFKDLLSGYPNSPTRFKGHADAHGWCILLWNATQWEQAAEGNFVRSKGELRHRKVQVEEEEEVEVGVSSSAEETESSTEEEVEVGVSSSTEEEEESEEDTAEEEEYDEEELEEEEEEEVEVEEGETSDSYKSFSSSSRSSTDL